MSSGFQGELSLCSVRENVKIEWSELEKLNVIEYIKQQQQNGMNRIIIGIAGGPGSGKSMFGELLSIYLNQKLGIKNICISADGYHYSNKILIKKGIRHEKGLPNTMNHHQFYIDMLKLKDDKIDNVYFPIYDREIHDPINNVIKVENDTKVIIFEGLYMIYWNNIRKLLDYIIFMEADTFSMKNRLSIRKIKGGKTIEEAKLHYDNVDKKTTKITQSGKFYANSVIKSDTNQTIINNEINKYTVIKYKQLSILSKL